MGAGFRFGFAPCWPSGRDDCVVFLGKIFVLSQYPPRSINGYQFLSVELKCFYFTYRDLSLVEQ